MLLKYRIDILIQDTRSNSYKSYGQYQYIPPKNVIIYTNSRFVIRN